MSSSFTIGATTVSFDAVESITDEAGPLEEITIGLLVASSTEWGALFSLRSWDVTTRPIPGGSTVYVDIGGGAGPGSLVIDGISSHTAVLTKLTGQEIEPGTLRYFARATWLITA